MQVSELITNARARRNVQAMTGPCQALERSYGVRDKFPWGKMISHILRRYKSLN